MKSLARSTARGWRDAARHAATVTVCATACMAADAGDFSVGVGVGADRGKPDCVAGYACDHGSTYAKLFLGLEVAPNVELQALAFDAGHFDGGDTSPLGTPFGGRFKVSGAAAAVGYRWSFAPDWSLKGQLGVAQVRTQFDYAVPFSGDVSESTTQPLLGLSLAWRVAPNLRLSLDVDGTRFKVYTSRGSLRMFGLAAQFAF